MKKIRNMILLVLLISIVIFNLTTNLYAINDSKNSVKMHSPVASSYFYSYVSYTSSASNITLTNWKMYSDLACSTKKATASKRTVTFNYQGFDSNFQQFSGPEYHYYS